jgi:hypothetical protein
MTGRPTVALLVSLVGITLLTACEQKSAFRCEGTIDEISSGGVMRGQETPQTLFMVLTEFGFPFNRHSAGSVRLETPLWGPYSSPLTKLGYHLDGCLAAGELEAYCCCASYNKLSQSLYLQMPPNNVFKGNCVPIKRDI